MNTVQIRLYDLFRKELHLTDDKAAAFVSAVEEVVEGAVEVEIREESQGHSTKEDIRLLELKLDKHFLSTRDDIHRLEINLEKHTLSTREDIHLLELKLEQTKSDIYKSMFWTGLVQLLAILGGVMTIVKFMK